MIGSRRARNQSIPVPPPPEALDWLHLLGEARDELQLQARTLEPALRIRYGKAGVAKSTWQRILAGEYLPSGEVFGQLVSHQKFDEPCRERLLAAWEKAWSGLERLEADTRAAKGAAVDPPARHDDGNGAASPPPPRPVLQWSAGRSGKQAFAIVGVLAIICVSVLVGRYLPESGKTTAGPESPRDVAAGKPTGQTPSLAGPLASGAVGSATELGGNHKCGRIRYLNGLAWTPCTRADGDTPAFVLRLTNTGPQPITVRAKLAYVQTAVSHDCPGPWGTGLEVTIGPGESVVSSAKECTAA
ncbi:hypothetical protein [Streptomyces sp. ISL-94]|uniref:hypothetical protein n=1 Tax=Streptomyces sp. ISL-94 TaxID=2819190 RepID=UPI001BEA1CC1|nr:hypothetical protein [Streptomyces sp. ISL-94]MBT2476858.1 hypothetical protein [Streptomyces sp. ISL-94]